MLLRTIGLEYNKTKKNNLYLISYNFLLNQTILFKKKIYTNNFALQAFSEYFPMLNLPLYIQIVSSCQPLSFSSFLKIVYELCISEVEQDYATHRLTKKVFKTHRYYKNKQSPHKSNTMLFCYVLNAILRCCIHHSNCEEANNKNTSISFLIIRTQLLSREIRQTKNHTSYYLIGR